MLHFKVLESDNSSHRTKFGRHFDIASRFLMNLTPNFLHITCNCGKLEDAKLSPFFCLTIENRHKEVLALLVIMLE